MATATFNPAAFTKTQLNKMLDNPALGDFHAEIIAHLSGVPTSKPKAKAAPKAKAKTTPKASTKKTYTVDEGKVVANIGKFVEVTSYSSGSLKLKPTFKNGVVLMKTKAEVQALLDFINENWERFSD